MKKLSTPRDSRTFRTTLSSNNYEFSIWLYQPLTSLWRNCRQFIDVWGCLLMHSSQAEVRILTRLLQHFKSFFFFYTSAPLANDHLITCIWSAAPCCYLPLHSCGSSKDALVCFLAQCFCILTQFLLNK